MVSLYSVCWRHMAQHVDKVDISFLPVIMDPGSTVSRPVNN